MNDVELVELIHSKPPEELSLEEIERLRVGLANSVNLRREVAERLEIEQYLQAALARVDLSIDDLIAKAERRVAGPTPVGLMVLGLCGVIGLAVGLLIVLAIVLPRSSEPVLLAQQQADKPAEAPPEDSASQPSATDEAVSELTALQIAANRKAENAVEEKPSPANSVVANNQAALNNAATDSPWSAAVAALAQAAPPASELFRGVPANVAPPSPELLRQWFAAVPGQRGEFGVRDYGGFRLGSIEGVVKLLPPLTPGLALRLSLVDWGALRIHAWSGGRGVMLDCYENHGNRPWAGYVTWRTEDAPLAAKWSLAADDDDRYWRTNPQPLDVVELRYADGVLTLSRGNVRLLDVPLATQPAEVFFEGKLLVRHIELVHAAPLPTLRGPLLATDELSPAKQPWQLDTASGAQLTRNDDGSVELQCENNPQPVWATMPLKLTGPQEIELEVTHAAPGSGIVLCDATGNRVRQLSFVRDPKHDLLQLTTQLGVGDTRLELERDLKHEPVAYIAPPCWVKLLAAPQWLRVWVSTDRVHWARVDAAHIHHLTGLAAIGLQLSPRTGAASIKLRRLTLRGLKAVSELAPAELLAMAPLLDEPADLAAFAAAAEQHRPAKADAAQWWRACAVRRLAWGDSHPLMESLLAELWRDSLRMRLPTVQRLQLLDQLGLLLPSTDGNRAQAWLAQYVELGRNPDEFEPARVFSRVCTAMMQAPLWTRGPCDFWPVDLARRQALELAAQRNGDALAEFCQQVQFFALPTKWQQEPFYRWAAALAGQLSDSNPDADAMPADWRHPLLVELNKEAYNLLADLRTALEAGNLREACQQINAVSVSTLRGLLPDASDPDLSISLAGTIAVAMREQPALRETMQREFGAVAKLRVANLLREANEAEVEAATIQFFGTAAAAEAHVWLADRALASGAFAAALSHYRAARESAGSELIPRINAGEQLAETLMGREVTIRPGDVMEIQGRRVAADAWLRTLHELRKQQTTVGALAAPLVRAQSTKLPVPKSYQITTRARLDGEIGQHAEHVPSEYQQAGPDWPALSLDWVARQVSVLPLADRMLISNRYQLASYDVGSGQLQWRAGLGGDQAPAHEWRLSPARPIAAAGRAYVRRLKAQGPTLAAIELATGQVAWETTLPAEQWAVSDPILSQGALYVVAARHSEWGYAMALLTIDLPTGVVLRERPLAIFRESWWQWRDCQVLSADERLFVVSAGAVLCCDLMGNVIWTRKQLLVPTGVDTYGNFAERLPPLLHAGTLVVVQPGVPGVTALDARSGRRLWQAKLTTPRRVLGIVEDRILVETPQGIYALAMDDGRQLWHYPSTNLLDGYLLATRSGLAIAERQPMPDGPNFQVRLTWLDTASGAIRHHALLEQPSHPQVFFGPMWLSKNRWWALSGQGVQDATRNLVEISAK